MNIRPGLHVWKYDVPSNKLKKELLRIFKDFSTANKKSLAPNPWTLKGSKPYFRFRILEYGVNIRDFSFFNFNIKNYDDNIVEFQTVFSGKMDNWIHFNSPCDIIFDDNNSYIIINVQGKVNFKNGISKYEYRDDIKKIQNMNTKMRNEYKYVCFENCGRDFLKQRRVTKKSIEHVKQLRQRLMKKRSVNA